MATGTYFDCEIININADISRGGWQVRGTVYNDANAITENQEVEIFLNAKTDGIWDLNFLKRFQGYALPQSIRRFHDRSTMEFVAYTSDAYLKRGRVQGIYFIRHAAPSNAHQIAGMTSGHIVEHLIDGHTNMGPSTPAPNGWVNIDDIDLTNSADLTVLALHEGIIWERIKQLAENEFYVCYFSKDDYFHYIPHPCFNTPLPTATMEWDNNFFAEPLEIIPRTDKRVKQVHLRALTDAGAILTAIYPATSPAVVEPEAFGEPFTKFRLRCNTQAQLNTWAERIYQWENRDYTIRVHANGIAGVYFELLDLIQITHSNASDGIDWSQENFFIHKIDVQLNPKDRTAKSTFTLEQAADTDL